MRKYQIYHALLMLLSTLNLCSCEKTKIYAQKTDDLIEVDQLALLLCQTDEDCPQWTCVESHCAEYQESHSPYFGQKVCIPKRKSIKLQSSNTLDQNKIENISSFDLSSGANELYAFDAQASKVKVYQKQSKTWQEKDNFDVDLAESKKIIAGPDRSIFFLFGSQVVLVDIQSRLAKAYGLSDEVHDLLIDESGLWWASVGSKGIELINTSNNTEDIAQNNDAREANPRFETAGIASKALSSKSYLIVADQFAGLSSFLRKTRGGLESAAGARTLQTPAQELSTYGQVMDIAIADQRVISAEYGAGLGVLELSAQGGLLKNHQLNFNAHVTHTALIDPFTAIVVTEGKRIFLVDLLQIENLNQDQKQLSFDPSLGDLKVNDDGKIMVELGASKSFKQISTIKWIDQHVYWLDDQERSLYSLELLCE